MHIENLPSPIRERLRNAGTQITAKVMIEATTREVLPNGTFGSGYATYRFDISDRLLEMPRISLEGPRWPCDIGEADEYSTRATECTLRLSNTDAVFAVAQNGSILRAEDIEQAHVWIYANVGGTLVNWFGGRVVGRPTETFAVTSVTVIGYLWEAIRKPVVYENFGSVQGTSQDMSGGEAGLSASMVRIDCIGQHFCMNHGLLAYDGGGRHVARFRRTAGTTINLLSMRIANSAACGKYTIAFKSNAGYVLRSPNNTIYTGNRFRGLPDDSPIQIDPAFWTSGGTGLGCEFEFWVSWSGEGNGIAMAYHLLEKALLQNPGIVSGNPNAALDTASFTFWAQRFAAFKVHVDATNENNEVFEGKDNARPLEYATLAQKILSHYQCSLTMLIDGTISIVGPYLDDRPSYPHRTDEAIIGDSIQLQGGDTVNYITVNFGGDPDGGYAIPIVRDLNPNAEQRVEKIFSLPYIKVGVGTRFALWWERMVVRRFMRKQTVIEYDLEPGHGLLITPGDYITVVSNELPRVTQRAMVVTADRGIMTDARVKAAMVQDGEGEAAIVQSAEVGSVGVW